MSYEQEQAERLAREERIYQQVRGKLSAARQQRVEDAKSDPRPGMYAHDLYGAVRAGERAIEREKAGAYLTEVCGGNIFKAIGLLSDAYFDSDPQPSKHASEGWTPTAQIKRALTKEAEDRSLEQTKRWSDKRREEGGS